MNAEDIAEKQDTLMKYVVNEMLQNFETREQWTRMTIGFIFGTNRRYEVEKPAHVKHTTSYLQSI